MAQEALNALLREKRNVLRQIVETRRAVLQNNRASGVGNGLDYSREYLELLKIELELAETPAAKRAVLETMVKVARNVEEVQQAMRNSGVGDGAGILQAKVERLNFQIQLEEIKTTK